MLLLETEAYQKHKWLITGLDKDSEEHIYSKGTPPSLAAKEFRLN